MYTMCEGLKLDAYRSQSIMCVANTILLVNKNKILKVMIIYIETLSVADWDTWDDSLVF